jgi:hypothetical protein
MGVRFGNGVLSHRHHDPSLHRLRGQASTSERRCYQPGGAESDLYCCTQVRTACRQNRHPKAEHQPRVRRPVLPPWDLIAACPGSDAIRRMNRFGRIVRRGRSFIVQDSQEEILWRIRPRCNLLSERLACILALIFSINSARSRGATTIYLNERIARQCALHASKFDARFELRPSTNRRP